MEFNQDTLDAMAASLRAGQYNLLLGSGVSTDSSNGKGPLPSGERLRSDLCDLKGVNENSPLQRVYDTLSCAERQEQIIERFINCTPGSTAKKLTEFLWHRIFTFNVDDVLENAYKEDETLQNPAVFHFDDSYSEVTSLAEVPIIHLHGSVKQPEKGFVFSYQEYVRQIKSLNPWMVVLTQFLPVEPFIIMGTSLNEVDLAFYLSYRSQITAREDRGPSILVEPNPDVATENDCRKYNLVLYKGNAEDFLSALLNKFPYRPTPIELISRATRNLLPPEVSKVESLSFASDFELVPNVAPAGDPAENTVTRFLYGQTPDWVDLASNKDISRPVSARIVRLAEDHFKNSDDGPKIIVIEDDTGSGKSTIVRRSVFELSRQGFKSLHCSATNQIEPRATAAIIDYIDGPLVIMVDDFADQVTAISELVECLNKRDIVFVCAERVYRTQYIQQAMGSYPYARIVRSLKLRDVDAKRLVEHYRNFGLLGAKELSRGRNTQRRQEFVHSIRTDPIAIACCRILNDFRPLNGIVDSLIEQTPELALRRYLITALAHHCFRAGVRHSVLRNIAGGQDWREQFEGPHPMPLTYSKHDNRDFILPENTTLASRILERVSKENSATLLEVFVDLANAIAPRVNPIQIRKKAPEARLATRLFDYDQIVEPFLGRSSSAFYAETKGDWDWNSRYWSQVALMYLAKYYSDPENLNGKLALAQAGFHARHARSIEEHSVVLTTLGQVLLAQMADDKLSATANFNEAFAVLEQAVDLEKQWIKPSIHPFVSLFRGARRYAEIGGKLGVSQTAVLRDMLQRAENKFRGDRVIQEEVGLLYSHLN